MLIPVIKLFGENFNIPISNTKTRPGCPGKAFAKGLLGKNESRLIP